MKIILVAVGLASTMIPIASFASTKIISDYEIVVAESAVDAQSPKQLRANCPVGKRALSAGWGVLDSTSAILDGSITYFEPSFDGKSWTTNARNNSTFAKAWKLRIRLVCAIAP